MNVSELARRTGLSPSGVRWYETVGVLPAAPRKENGYREYSEGDLRLLQLVTTLRRVGLSPAEAGRLARLCIERGAAGPEVPAALAYHHHALRRQRIELERLDWELTDLEATIESTRSGLVARAASAVAPISVLFLCNGNSGRSQIAEALLTRHGGTAFEAQSAGFAPKPVSDGTVRVLAEDGIDWSQGRAKSIDEFFDRSFEYVITLADSARERCPALAGPHNALHWRLDDPAEVKGALEERLDAYRWTRDQVMLRLRPFIELAAHAAHLTPPRPQQLKEFSLG
ncbi:MAG: MerR family transcriptional regulator [Anaerolineaceae bacterium]